MKDKLYKFEKKTYELLGVKKFRKIAFKSREIIWYPFTFRMKKKIGNNYFIILQTIIS